MNICEKDIEEKYDNFLKKLNELDDWDLENYVAPLLNIENLTDEKIYSLEKLLKYYIEETILISLPDDHRYNLIANYQDFEFTNCIAYEMAIRTDEYQKWKFLYMTVEDISRIKNDIVKNMLDSLQYLHEDIRKIITKYIDASSSRIDFKGIENELELELNKSAFALKEIGILNPRRFLNQDLIDFTEGNFTLLRQEKYNLTIDDFDNGLERVLKFYLPKNKIYILENNSFKQIANDKIEDKTIRDFVANIILQKYHYFIKINNENIYLSNGTPIIKLDSNCREYLKEYYKGYKNIDITLNHTRPILYFSNSKIVNLPINMNFSKDELMSLLSKIKDDYDKNKNLIKTPIELLGEKMENFIKPKSEKKLMAKNKQKEKIRYANAFCVYDLDKVLTPIFNRKNKEFIKKKRKGEIDKNEINPYTKEYLKSEIASIVGISEDDVKIYRTLMHEYINNKKFIELIAGVSKSTN